MATVKPQFFGTSITIQDAVTGGYKKIQLEEKPNIPTQQLYNRIAPTHGLYFDGVAPAIVSPLKVTRIEVGNVTKKPKK